MRSVTPYEKNLLVLLVLFSFLAGYFIWSEFSYLKTEKIKSEHESLALGSTFLEYVGEAQAFSVYDADDRRFIFEKNSQTARPLASITKVMTAVVALQILGKDETLRISNEALMPEGDEGLRSGEKWEASDLASFTLINSSNDGALALALAAGEELRKKNNDSRGPLQLFLQAMNDKARRLGLATLHFESPNGLDINDITPTAFGSSSEVAQLFSFAITLYPEVFGATKNDTLLFNSQSGFVHTAKNTNRSIGKIPGFIASKTGYTESAGGNLVIAYRAENGHTIVLAVLGSSKEGRFNDIEGLVRTANEYIKIKN